jgi:DNA polymerase III subunit gamma/tau
MAQVLYRKHRPQTFAQVVGQEHVKQTLQNALSAGAVAHAYLFAGPRGTGKTTLARIFARALNCTARTKEGEACQKCAACKEPQGTAMDLIEIDAASNRGIDEIRELKEGVRFAPTQNTYKVYLIDEVHMLTKEAFNALLKTLEEPPEHAIFILATTEPHKVLPTIISRTQRFDFRKLTHDEIAGRLAQLVKKEKRKLDPDAVRLVVAASGGSMRDAESILGKILSLGNPSTEEIRTLLGIADTEKVTTLLAAIFSGDKDTALKFVNELADAGQDVEQFAHGVIDYTRILLLLKLSPSSATLVTADFTAEERKHAQAQLATVAPKVLYDVMREFLDAVQEMKYSPMPQLPLELAVVKLTEGE